MQDGDSTVKMESSLNHSDSGNECDLAGDGEVCMDEETNHDYNTSSAGGEDSSNVGAADKPTLHVLPIDCVKRGEYEGSDNETYRIRIQLKDITVTEVIFHQKRIQVHFSITTTHPDHPFLVKFKANPRDTFEWSAELFDDIVPSECSMIDGKELVLRKRDPSKRWTSSLAASTSLDMTYNGISSRLRDASVDRAASVLSRCTISSTSTGTASTATYRRSKYTGSDYSRYSIRDCRTTYIPSDQFRSRSTSTLCRSSTMSTLDKKPTTCNLDRPAAPQIGSRLSSSYHRDLDSSSYSGSLSPTKSKPTARVVPYDEPVTAVVEPGYTGLRNMGNTCFMNATLQMLVNTAELKKYFLAEKYKRDVNSSNPLGFGGRLAEAFGEFMTAMWSGLLRTHEPKQIKNIVAEKANQFANYAQHDAQEFLSFLLDGLHEDLNRVRHKPNTGTVEANGRPDRIVAGESWANHLRRNDSVIVELFHGQLKSHLECPKCHHHSITFDPFMYLPLSLPKAKSTATIMFWPADSTMRPRRLTIHYNADGNAGDFLGVVSDKTKIPSQLLKMVEVANGKFQKIYDRSDTMGSFLDSASLHIYELRDESAYQEEIVEMYVVQRLLYNHTVPRHCAQCESANRSLKTCDRCYNVFYCSEKCQQEHWDIHREICSRRENSERVGVPFIISVPRSQLSHSYLMHMLQFKCMHSVNVFELPHTNNKTVEENSDSSEPVASTSNSIPKTKLTNSFYSPKKLYVPPEASKKAEHRLYMLRYIQNQDSFRGETLKSDSNEKLKSIPKGSFLSVNWYNLRCGKEHLSVETKSHIDLDPETSDKYIESRRFQKAACPNLSDMLALFSEPERLKPEEAWYCTRCKEHVEATKTMELYRLPRILIIQLKRFVYSGSGYSSLFNTHRRTKDDRMVQYPIENLDLRKYLSGAAQPRQETTYDLTGIVCHTGTSFYGHYVSMGRLTNESGTNTRIGWRNFDDGIVTDVRSEAKTETDEAYLLFYKQRG